MLCNVHGGGAVDNGRRGTGVVVIIAVISASDRAVGDANGAVPQSSFIFPLSDIGLLWDTAQTRHKLASQNVTDARSSEPVCIPLVTSCRLHGGILHF